MKALILAAGLGKRLKPLTLTKPKPLLKILNKTILEHNLEQLKGWVKEVILVVGYLGEQIEKKIGKNYKGIKIYYLWQKNPTGTGSAALLAKNLLPDQFLILNGDDFYFEEDLKKLTKKFPAILVKKVENPENFGVILIKGKTVSEILEKPKNPPSNLVNVGAYFLPKSIFQFSIKKSVRGEYEFTDFVKKFIQKQKLYLSEAKKWFPITFPWNLFGATNLLMKREKEKREGKIEKNVILKGKIILEKGAQIRSGSYIVGPVYIGKKTVLGPNCFVREGCVIGDNCRIGAGVELKNSIIGENTYISHFSYVGDSIIGENCNVGAGTIFANLRFDERPVKVCLDGKIIDTKRKKLGAIIGDNVKIGVNCSLMPGTLIGPNTILGPHSCVKENVKANERKISYCR